VSLYPPTYNLRELADRIAQETDRPVIDVTKALAGAILDKALPVEAHFPQQDVAVNSPVPGLAASALMHLKEVANSLARPEQRPDDLVRIVVRRDAFRDWAVKEGHALPKFWFGAVPGAPAAADEQERAARPRRKLPREEQKQRTQARDRAIVQRAKDLRTLDPFGYADHTKLAKKIAMEMREPGSPLSDFDAIDSETIRKIVRGA
jgi:hypothetical protein